jgi:YVTN family beta-propeller protein
LLLQVTRIDTDTLEIKGVIDTGLITNHLGFAKTARGTLAYVTIGGENVVKVYTTDATGKLLATIPVGALPHGIWPSDDGTRMYVGLENGDAVDVIDTATDRVIARVPVGQAPQALVYVSNAVPHGTGTTHLVPRVNDEPINLACKPTRGEGRGFVVARNLGLVDSLEVYLFELTPQTVYNVYVSSQPSPIASFKTNPAGAANGTVIGPLRDAVSTVSSKTPSAAQILVVEGDAAPLPANAILISAR